MGNSSHICIPLTPPGTCGISLTVIGLDRVQPHRRCGFDRDIDEDTTNWPFKTLTLATGSCSDQVGMAMVHPPGKLATIFFLLYAINRGTSRISQPTTLKSNVFFRGIQNLLSLGIFIGCPSRLRRMPSISAPHQHVNSALSERVVK